jgi:predicted enzyme related to lactoylglutathione lyase
MDERKIGTVGWHDLTVPDAERIKDFYKRVVGLESSPVDMGGYSDFNMLPPGGGDAVAGVCHARGGNANLPPQWVLYFVVENVERSAQACVDGGGELISPIRKAGAGTYCVIKDPAGAVCAIYQP